MINPFENQLSKSELKSWRDYLKIWLMKGIWNLSGRKFQALVMSIIICLIFQTDTWIILSCLGAYAGLNIVEKFKLK